MAEEMDNAEFYRGETFKLIMKRFDDLETSQKQQAKDIQEIKSKINYMWGYAAGAAFIMSFVISYVKDWFFKVKI